MNTGELQCDYFNVEADSNIFHLLQEFNQRKPSCDDFLIDLFTQQRTFITSNQNTSSKQRKSTTQPIIDQKQKKQRKNSKANILGRKSGHWSSSQSKKYHWFLELHCSHFLNKHLRRTDKIFKAMEKFVKTREAQQCRSHHQKMEIKHGNFINILKELRILHYGSGDPELILSDIKLNQVECNQQLLSWSMLLGGMQQKWEWLDEQKPSPTEISPYSQSFIDPLAEMQEEGHQFLQLLIL